MELGKALLSSDELGGGPGPVKRKQASARTSEEPLKSECKSMWFGPNFFTCSVEFQMPMRISTASGTTLPQSGRVLPGGSRSHG